MKNFKIYVFSVAVFVGTVLYSAVCLAQWTTDPNLNNPVCVQQSNQEKTAIASDGSGGSYIVWVDGRVAGPDIYAQHIDAAGVIKWTSDGIALCNAIDYQGSPAIIPDGNGGAIITWMDYRNGNDNDIYAQHIDGNGTMLWDDNGKAIFKGTGDQAHPIVATDGTGGAIIAWLDQSIPGARDYKIKTERIDANGQLVWGSSSMAVTIADTVGTKSNPVIIADGNGGAIVAWTDFRSYYGGNSATDIYAQRIDGTGSIRWGNNGKIVSNTNGYEDFPAMASDGIGGAVITWQDDRNEVDQNIYAQRMSAGGTALWAANGIKVCDASKNQTYPVIISYQSGGVIIAWNDLRNFGGSAIYAQRVNGNGITQWTSNGYFVSGDDSKAATSIIPDGNGGAIIAFESYSNSTSDIYATHLSSTPAVEWTSVISNSAWSQKIPHLVSDNLGGATITWEDYRSNSNIDIYAQHVKADGVLGNSYFTGLKENSDIDVKIYPNPVTTELFIDVSLVSNAEQVEVTLLDLTGRKIETQFGNGIIRINMAELPKTAYLLKITDGKQILTRKIIKK